MSRQSGQVTVRRFSIRADSKCTSRLEIAELTCGNGMKHEQLSFKDFLLLTAHCAIFVVPTRIGTVACCGDHHRARSFEVPEAEQIYRAVVRGEHSHLVPRADHLNEVAVLLAEHGLVLLLPLLFIAIAGIALAIDALSIFAAAHWRRFMRPKRRRPTHFSFVSREKPNRRGTCEMPTNKFNIAVSPPAELNCYRHTCRAGDCLFGQKQAHGFTTYWSWRASQSHRYENAVENVHEPGLP